MKLCIKFTFLILLFVFPLFCFSQEIKADSSAGDIGMKTYYAAKDNYKSIPFIVSNASKPSASIISISAVGKESFKLDNLNNNPISLPYVVSLKSDPQNPRNRAATGMDQSFDFEFIPRDTGECIISIKGYDESRKNSAGGANVKEIRLIVVNPSFMDPYLAPPEKVTPGDRCDLEFDVACKGMADFNSYTLIYTFKNPIADTIIGSKFLMKKELITKEDIGKKINIKSLYKGRSYSFYDDTTKGAKPKSSNFSITVDKATPKVSFSQRNQRLPYNEAILFNASYYGNCGNAISGLKEADVISVEITSTASGDPIFDRWEMRTEGKFAAYVDQSYFGSNPIEEGSAVDIEIKVKVKGASDAKAKLKLIPPKVQE
jgi:hypothetical protein